MNDIPYADLRALLSELERQGRLYRWRRQLNKDTELSPLMRLQYRGLTEQARRVFLYENIVDSKGRRYGMRVAAGVYGASSGILALGLGCQNVNEIAEKWRSAVAESIPPVVVDDGPVHQEVHAGEELRRLGLDELPVPVEEPGFSGGVRTTTPIITRDPETGIRNVGTYSGHFAGPDLLLAGIGPTHHASLYHLAKARARGEPLPVAITVGTLPDIVFAASVDLPYGVDELAVAGGLRGRPVELVRCKTIPLEVPAEAEIVIEGQLSTEESGRESAFSDYPGYLMTEHHERPVVKVTAITHRHEAIFTPILVGLAPSECNVIIRCTMETMLYNHLKHGSGHHEVLEVGCPEVAGGYAWWVIRIRKTHPSLPSQVLHAAAGMTSNNKVIIVVDEDIDPKDPESVMWALSFAMQPHRDVQIIMGRRASLDPSAYSLMLGPQDRGYPPPSGTSGMLIDATRKGAYPPVGLPAQEYTEAALRIWRDEGLPQLSLREPWYGYKLGDAWDEEDDERARRAAQGESLNPDGRGLHLAPARGRPSGKRTYSREARDASSC